MVKVILCPLCKKKEILEKDWKDYLKILKESENDN